MRIVKIHRFFSKFQNRVKIAYGVNGNIFNDNHLLDNITADTADLEAVLQQSKELLKLTDEVKIQTADLVIKIGIEA